MLLINAVVLEIRVDERGFLQTWVEKGIREQDSAPGDKTLYWIFRQKTTHN